MIIDNYESIMEYLRCENMEDIKYIYKVYGRDSSDIKIIKAKSMFHAAQSYLGKENVRRIQSEKLYLGDFNDTYRWKCHIIKFDENMETSYSDGYYA